MDHLIASTGFEIMTNRNMALSLHFGELDASSTERIRSATQRIRTRVKKTIEDLIEIGRDLKVVKEALPHGQFGRWLNLEFGWKERMAQHFMAVAQQFGSKTAIITDLAIQPTAAFLLAAPSTPDAARELALKRAGAGERITIEKAKEFLSKFRTRKKRKPKQVPMAFLQQRLQKTLAWFRDRWSEKDCRDLIRQLREFADELERKVN